MATQDVDLVVGLFGRHVPEFVERLQDEFYVDQDAALAAVRARTCFNLVHLETLFKIDIFAAAMDPLSRAEMSRRVWYQVTADLRLPVCSAEDIVIQKLDWYRKGGGVSDRQLNDVLGVLKVQGDRIDREYLETWCASLGLSDLLTEVLDDAGSST